MQCKVATLSRVIIPVGCAFMVFDCNQNSFNGDSGKRTAPAAQAAAAPSPGTPTPILATNTAATPETSVTPALPSPPSTVPTSPQPSVSSAPSSVIPDLAKILGGLITTLQEQATSQSNDGTQITFGGSKVFHIGDGAFDASSNCAGQIDAYRLKGTTYYFSFQVLQDNTTVNIAINKICGIDYKGTDTISFGPDSGSATLSQAINVGDTSATLAPQVLAAGNYTILVDSAVAGSQNAQNPSDHDDFIVGNVQVNADKPIKAGKIGAQ